MDFMNFFRKRGEEIPDKTDNTNGLVLNNVYIPEEILTYILSYIDTKRVLKCRLVCSNWDELIKSYHFWKLHCERKNIKVRKNLPWSVYYCQAVGDFLNVNLIHNNCGQNKLHGWKIMENGGDKWTVEEEPQGADPLPKSEDFGGKKSCFATSYQSCSKMQKIYIKNGLHMNILDKLQPKIVFSEWFAGRFDCGCEYTLVGLLLDSKGKEIKQQMECKRVEQWAGRMWTKVEITMEDYGPGVRHIKFIHSGQDTQFWAGHYGSKMAGASIKICLDER